MVRNYQKKTDRTAISEEAVADAINDYINGKGSLRTIANTHSLKFATLQYRLKLYNEQKKTNVSTTVKISNTSLQDPVISETDPSENNSNSGIGNVELESPIVSASPVMRFLSKYATFLQLNKKLNLNSTCLIVQICNMV